MPPRPSWKSMNLASSLITPSAAFQPRSLVSGRTQQIQQGAEKAI